MPHATTILITGIGGPTPRAITRALKRYGHHGPYRLIGTDVNPRVLGLYHHTYLDRAYLVPPANCEGYREALTAICQQEHIDAALIQPEAEVEAWAWFAQNQFPLPCRTMLPDYAFVRLARDKARMHDLLSSTTYIPRYKRIKAHYDNLAEAGNILGYPFWLRATKGTSGAGSYCVRDLHQAQAWIALNPDVTEFLASEYLPGRNLACELLYQKGMLLRAACAERVTYIMSNVAPSKITGNTAFGRLLNYPEAITLASECVAAVCRRLGAGVEGLITVDLKEDAEGAPKVTEINVRHIAFTDALAAAGANLVEDHLSLTLGHTEWISAPVLHTFQEPLVFLRDVDAEPLVLPEREILSATVGVPAKVIKRHEEE